MLCHILIPRPILRYISMVVSESGAVFSLTVSGIMRSRIVCYVFCLLVFILSCTILSPHVTIGEIVDIQPVAVPLLLKI